MNKLNFFLFQRGSTLDDSTYTVVQKAATVTSLANYSVSKKMPLAKAKKLASPARSAYYAYKDDY